MHACDCSFPFSMTKINDHLFLREGKHIKINVSVVEIRIIRQFAQQQITNNGGREEENACIHNLKPERYVDMYVYQLGCKCRENDHYCEE